MWRARLERERGAKAAAPAPSGKEWAAAACTTMVPGLCLSLDGVGGSAQMSSQDGQGGERREGSMRSTGQRRLPLVESEEVKMRARGCR